MGIVRARSLQHPVGLRDQRHEMIGRMAERGMIKCAVRLGDRHRLAAQPFDQRAGTDKRGLALRRHREGRADHPAHLFPRLPGKGHRGVDRRAQRPRSAQRGEDGIAFLPAHMHNQWRARHGTGGGQIGDHGGQRIVGNRDDDQVAARRQRGISLRRLAAARRCQRLRDMIGGATEHQRRRAGKPAQCHREGARDAPAADHPRLFIVRSRADGPSPRSVRGVLYGISLGPV